MPTILFDADRKREHTLARLLSSLLAGDCNADGGGTDPERAGRRDVAAGEAEAARSASATTSRAKLENVV